MNTPCLIAGLTVALTACVLLAIIIHSGKGAPGFLASNAEVDSWPNIKDGEPQTETSWTVRDDAQLKELWRKGEKAWADVPNATEWVEEMRGNAHENNLAGVETRAVACALESHPVDGTPAISICQLPHNPAPLSKV